MHASNLQHLQHVLHHDIGFKMPFEMVTVKVAIDIILLVLNSFFIFPNQQFFYFVVIIITSINI